MKRESELLNNIISANSEEHRKKGVSFNNNNQQNQHDNSSIIYAKSSPSVALINPYLQNMMYTGTGEQPSNIMGGSNIITDENNKSQFPPGYTGHEISLSPGGVTRIIQEVINDDEDDE